MIVSFCEQVKDVLFEPVRKTQDAMHFKRINTKEGEMWMPCGPREPGARQTTMTELAAEGQASKVRILARRDLFYSFLVFPFLQEVEKNDMANLLLLGSGHGIIKKRMSLEQFLSCCM